jgi:hypothetical protein
MASNIWANGAAFSTLLPACIPRTAKSVIEIQKGVNGIAELTSLSAIELQKDCLTPMILAQIFYKVPFEQVACRPGTRE